MKGSKFVKIGVIGFIFIVIMFLDSFFHIKSILPTNFFHETTSLYFFSALLQSNAAIFSIVGIFIIFRIQSKQSILDSLKNTLMNNNGQFIWANTVIEFDNKSDEEKKKYILGQKKDSRQRLYLNSWVELEEKIYKIKDLIKFPTIIIAFGIIMNIFGLIFSNSFHSNINNLELLILISFTIFQIYIVVLVVKTIFKVLLDK